MKGILVCVLFLYQHAEVRASDLMSCTLNECFQLHQILDFHGAQKVCRDAKSELVSAQSPEVQDLLVADVGSYWLEAVDADTCTIMNSRAEVSNISCSEEAGKFVCRSRHDMPCAPLVSQAGAQVRYYASNGAQVIRSDRFPPATTAETFKAGGKYPSSKHICAFNTWTGAPWSCEVAAGGCAHLCNGTSCVCPPGQVLHPNRFSCTDDPCAACQHRCDRGACACHPGYALQPDGKSCVDVDECRDARVCGGHGQQCENTQGGYACACAEDFEEHDGACVDSSICLKCEHECDRVVFACVCDKGFVVSREDPHRCEMHCDEIDCPARCTKNPDVPEKDWQCVCPAGYLLHYNNSTHVCTDIDECYMDMYCDHLCENLFGGFRCWCEEGYELRDRGRCVRVTEEGSGSEPLLQGPTAQTAAVPSYVKTGSILGLTVFSVLCVVLVFFLVRWMSKRCDKLELAPVKRTEVDIDYLQQVTTDTYKMLPVD